MESIKKHAHALAGLLGLGVALIGIAVTTMAQTVPPPVITIGLTNTDQLSITVTNGVAYGNYMLYNQHVLGGTTWTFVTNPVPGVTNFVINPEPYFEGFYIVTGSTNWNDSGIPNWDLADPNNPALGYLTVSIVSPSQGQIIQ